MSLCLIDVHGDIEGDFEWVEDLPKSRKEFLIAIEELEKIREEVKEESYSFIVDDAVYDLGYRIVDIDDINIIIDKHIAELKGEKQWK